MEELVATNNLVTISYIEALLTDSSIEYVILDQNMSILEGSIGIIPRRIMVAAENLDRASVLLRDAGLMKELSNQL